MSLFSWIGDAFWRLDTAKLMRSSQPIIYLYVPRDHAPKKLADTLNLNKYFLKKCQKINFLPKNVLFISVYKKISSCIGVTHQNRK
jgi:hypothetical protein